MDKSLQTFKHLKHSKTCSQKYGNNIFNNIVTVEG